MRCGLPAPVPSPSSWSSLEQTDQTNERRAKRLFDELSKLAHCQVPFEAQRAADTSNFRLYALFESDRKRESIDLIRSDPIPSERIQFDPIQSDGDPIGWTPNCTRKPICSTAFASMLP